MARSPEWKATANMQMLYMQHFPNPVITPNKRPIIWAVLHFAQEWCLLLFLPYMGMPVNEAWPFEQAVNPVSTVGATWWVWRVFNKIMILYMYAAQEQGKITLAE